MAITTKVAVRKNIKATKAKLASLEKERLDRGDDELTRAEMCNIAEIERLEAKLNENLIEGVEDEVENDN